MTSMAHDKASLASLFLAGLYLYGTTVIENFIYVIFTWLYSYKYMHRLLRDVRRCQNDTVQVLCKLLGSLELLSVIRLLGTQHA